MKCVVPCLFLLFACAHSANILGVFVFPSVSHQIVFQPIYRELSVRGHNVIAITPNPLNDSTLINLTEINISFIYDIIKKAQVQDSLSKELGLLQENEGFWNLMHLISEAELENLQVQELIRNQSRKFDLIIMEYLNLGMLGFMTKFKAPVLELTSLGATTWLYELFGNPAHPVLHPDLFEKNHINLSLWEKLQYSYHNLWLRNLFHHSLLPIYDAMARKYFWTDIPKIGELQQNVKMYLQATNSILYPPRPYVPAIGELGQTHIQPIKQLPTDLQKVLDNATEGVIYFSLGSNVKSVLIGSQLRKTIIEVLSELPYKILWKWEDDKMSDRPQNVIIRKWFPQQDLLAHKNVKAFLTQGGLQSVEEAITRHIPMIGMPFVFDQPMNAQRIAAAGIGLSVNPATVTKDELKYSIIKVAEDPQYKTRIKKICELMYDKPMTGFEQAVWWSEYFIRHKDVDYLKSPAIGSSWIEFLFLDIIVTAAVLLTLAIYLCWNALKRLNRA